MFVERMLHWARIFELATYTVSTMALIRVESIARPYAANRKTRASFDYVNNDPQRELAKAYVKMGSLNR